MPVSVGDMVPGFKLKNQHGEWVNIMEEIGKNILVIYFYPKNFTRGCTIQACSFRDSMEDFVDMGASVFGISEDSTSSHNSFASDHGLSYSLLSDPGKKVCKQFGAGKLLNLVVGRITYVVDKKGIVRHITDKFLNPESHIQEAIEAVKRISLKDEK